MRALVEAEGLTAHFEIDSAGTSAHHVGERADGRSRKAAARRGVDLTSRARQFEARDFGRFDLVLAMDQRNLADLTALARDDRSRQKLALLRSFDATAVERGALEVPDPYYGGPSGFDDVLDLCEAACRGLLEALRREHGLPG